MLVWMKRSATELRANLYATLDHVAKTGEPVEIMRGGIELWIVRKDAPVKAPKKNPRTLPNLIAGDPADLVHTQWPWNEGRDL